jgi:hypothetical protein
VSVGVLQALKHYGESVRLGHKAILQSLPRLLTLYFEFGSKVAATKNLNQRLKTAQTQVEGWQLVDSSGGGVLSHMSIRHSAHGVAELCLDTLVAVSCNSADKA